MRKALMLLAALALVAGCATSPTGRSQIRLYSNAQMDSMGTASFEEMKQKNKVSQDPQANDYVDCVGHAITRVVDPKTDWEVVLFKDDAANAFALPGGKIGVYTGLLDVAQNQSQLAAVLGHEVGHVEAQHANARLSAAAVTQAGVTALQILVGASDSQRKAEVMALLGVGAQVGILLPYSRSQESEADRLGLDYMARAGFDPHASVQLWKNMEKQGGGQPPEFLSTHPSHGTRIRDLERRMPRAERLYQQARARGRTPDCGPAPSTG